MQVVVVVFFFSWCLDGIHIPGGGGGTLPADLGLFTAMTSFGGLDQVLGREQYRHPLDDGWSALTYFEVFHNALTGTVPEFIGQWTKLAMFIASRNQRTGTRYRYPSDDGTALTYLDASMNGMTGTLPDSMVNWSKIQSALFSNSQFVGTMPVGFCPCINRTVGDRLLADCQSEINCTCCTQCV
jgi:hypothetical protein